MGRSGISSGEPGILERVNVMVRLARRLAIASLLLWSPHSMAAEDEPVPVFEIRFSDGRIEPLRLVVPADRRFKIVLRNDGQSPVEFESLELRKEKVVGPGVTTFLVIRRLDAGEYAFFDDFHPLMPQAKIIAE